jgi:hypothetical protein
MTVVPFERRNSLLGIGRTCGQQGEHGDGDETL